MATGPKPRKRQRRLPSRRRLVGRNGYRHGQRLTAAARWACANRPELLRALMLCIGPFVQLDDGERLRSQDPNLSGPSPYRSVTDVGHALSSS